MHPKLSTLLVRGTHSWGLLKRPADETQVFEATCYGKIAASFALEQIGLPSGKSYGDKQTWDGGDVASRLEAY